MKRMFDRNHISSLFAALAACVALACPAAGQSRLDSLQQVEEVVVTGHVVRKEVIPVQELSGEQLHKLSSHNVADALRYFSGIQIKDYGGVGGLKTVNIRSMGTNHVGVFYDGIELGNAQNGTVDLGRFSLDNMEAVTLYNGQKSAVFQPAKDFGSSGSIYLQTRTPRFDEGETHHVKATMKTGSFGLANPALLWEQRLSERVSSSLSAEYLYSTGRYKFTYRMQEGYDTTAVRRNGDLNALRVEGGLFGRVEQGYWRAKVYFYNSERGYPGAIVRNKFSHEDRQWDTNFFAQGSFKKDFKPWYSLLVNAKYAYDYLHYLADPNKDESLMYTNNHYYQQEAYLSAANRFTIFPWWEVNLSADWQFNLLNADLRDFVYPRRHTLLAAAATAMRFDRVEIQASLLGTLVHDRTKGDRMSDKRKLTPAVFLSWRPFERAGINIRAFYKRIFRMPTLNLLHVRRECRSRPGVHHAVRRGHHLLADLRAYVAAVARAAGRRLLQPGGQQDRGNPDVELLPLDDGQSGQRRDPRRGCRRADRMGRRARLLADRAAELHLPAGTGLHRPLERILRRTDPLHPLAQRLGRAQRRMAELGGELQLHIHRRALFVAGQHPLQLPAAVVHERLLAGQGVACGEGRPEDDSRGEQPAQPAV